MEEKQGYKAEINKQPVPGMKKKEDDLIDTYGDDFEDEIEE